MGKIWQIPSGLSKGSCFRFRKCGSINCGRGIVSAFGRELPNMSDQRSTRRRIAFATIQRAARACGFGTTCGFTAKGRLRVGRAQGSFTLISVEAVIADFIQRRCAVIICSCGLDCFWIPDSALRHWLDRISQRPVAMVRVALVRKLQDSLILF